MSKPTQSTTGGKPAPQPRSLAGSVWARGPPQSSQPASQNASPLQSPNPNNKEKFAGTDSAPVSAPSSGRQSQAGHKGKPAAPAEAAPVAAAKAVNIPTPPVAAPGKAMGLNFGTIDNPESMISSSPAAKPTTGAHLGEGEKVKSFGSVAAAAASAPAAASTDKTAAAPTKLKFDPHKMFQKAPQAQAQAQAASPAPAAATPSPAPSTSNPISPSPAPIALASPAPVPHNPYVNVPVQQHGQPGIQQARGYNAQGQPMVHAQPFSPSGAPPNGRGVQQHRSPIMNNAQPHVQPGFNPATAGVFQPAGPGGVRPSGRPTGQPMGNRGGPGFPPQMQGQQFPGMPQGYSPYQQHYGGAYGEFQPQYPYPQHYQGMPGGAGAGAAGQPGAVPPVVGSPNMGRPQLHNASSSFSSAASGLPTPGGPGAASPMSPQPTPGTPMQNHRAPTMFTPNAAAFSPGAAAFTPGGAPASPFVPNKPKSSAIKIARPDGTPLDLSTEAKKVKSTGPSAATIAAAASAAASASPKPAMATPVVVRIESPVQKQERERELEAEKKRKEDDARAEKERLERKEAKEREEKEAADKAQADKEKKEAEAAAEAEKRAQDEKAEQEKKAADDKAEADKKVAEEKQAADAKAEDDKKANESVPAPESIAAKFASFAGLPSKPSHEVLEKAKLAAPELDGISAQSTPRGSPAMSHASLAPVPEGRKAPPAGLNTASSLALKTAKVIEDIRAITYPAGISAPNSALNALASGGKFRYDREFLLQFLNICKEKVDYEASLESLIDKNNANQSSYSRSGSPRPGQMRRGNSSMNGPMGSFKGSGGPGGMGNFGSGNFGGRPAQTSAERYAASRDNLGNAFAGARNSQAPLSRTSSQTGINNMGQGGMRNDPRARSARGKPRDGGGRGPPQQALDPNVAPLEVSENRWTPGVQSKRPGQVDESSPEFVERKVKGLLNKLTAEKFASISNQILEWANKSVSEKDGQTLRLVIKLIFEKAKDEQFWSKMYASLCHKLWHDIDPAVADEQMLAGDGKPLSGGLLFRKYLLNRCQEDFEKGWKQKADASAAAKEKASDDQKKKAEHDAAVEAGGPVEEFKFSDEYYAEAAAKRQGLGLVKFIGELFKLEILSTKVIHSIIVKLLGNVVDPDEEDVESLCQLMTTVGAKMEAQPRMSQQVGLYMERMKDLARSEHLSSRIRFMVEDVIEMHRNRWQARNPKGEGGPMTIEQVHAQARAEAEASRVAASRISTNQMSRGNSASRGGSPRAHDRAGFGGPGGDAWTPVNNRLPAKPADMSAFGNIKTSGLPAFGPQSVFGRKKGGKASEDVTPPLSRTPSSNMFSALLEGNDDGESASSPADAPQRKRLQLQPRTVSSTDVDNAEPEAEADNASADGEAESGNEEMSEEQIERKIKNDVEELWGEKDQGGTRKPSDIAEYFESLPESGRTKLAAKLVEDVFRLSKQSDTDVVVKGFALALEQDVLTSEQAKEAMLPQIEMLDDLAMDVPKAYDFAAELIIVSNLQSEVDALGDAIESYGEPKITPKAKLLAAVEKQTAASA